MGFFGTPAFAQGFGKPYQRVLVATRHAHHIVERAGHQHRLDDARDALQPRLERGGGDTWIQLYFDDRTEGQIQSPQIDPRLVPLNDTLLFEAAQAVRYSVCAQKDAFAKILITDARVRP